MLVPTTRRVYRAAIFVIVAALATFVAKAESGMALGVETRTRPFDVKDSIEMSLFTDLDGDSRADNDDGSYSPDKKYYVKLTHRGVVAQNVMRSTMWLFRANEIARYANSTAHLQPPKPTPLVQRSATFTDLEAPGRGEVIRSLRWSADSRTISFLAHVSGQSLSLFVVEVPTGRLRVLTPPDQNVQQYAVENGTYVYLEKPKMPEREVWASSGGSIPDAELVGPDESLRSILWPNQMAGTYGGETFQLWTIKHGVPAPVVGPGGSIKVTPEFGFLPFLSLSPDAKTAVVIEPQPQVPLNWRRLPLGPLPQAKPMAVSASDGTLNWYRPRQYITVDLAKGIASPLVDAPYASSYQGWYSPVRAAVWSPDSRSVAVSNTFLATGSLERSRLPCLVAVFRSDQKPANCLIMFSSDQKGQTARPVRSVTWVDRATVAVELGKDDGSPTAIEQRLFRRIENAWVALPTNKDVRLAGDGTGDSLHPSIAIMEALDLSPRLVVTDRRTQHHATLFDPNPQLLGVKMGQTEQFRWTGKDGRKFSGLLILPPDFSKKRRYACVIQTHGFLPDKFVRTGLAEGGYAARALAGRDIVVLQVPEPLDFYSTSNEARRDGLDMYLAAIDALVSKNVIDPNRVGITGYSRTGFHVTTSLTSAPSRFAAAVLANTEGGTMMMYYLQVNEGARADLQDLERTFGGGASPVGAGLKGWAASAPGFNLDKVRAPVLFVAGDPLHLMAAWGTYAPLKDEGKIADMLYFRSGSHDLTKPLQRWRAEESVVDWYDFWLNQHEDPGAGKREQYVRWSAMRDQRQ